MHRITVWLCAMFFLAGCSTVRFTSTTSSGGEAATGTSPLRTSGYVSKTPESSVKSYQYGRFTVLVDESGSQKVEGGVFTPSPTMSFAPTRAHVLFINYVTKELSYYRRTGAGTYEPIIGYAVVTPLSQALPRDVVQGSVRRIDTAPTWCPTKRIREKYTDLPPGCLNFGHPTNAMGVAKFEVSWSVPGFELVRLHGTSGYPSGNFWEEETFGCTRLENNAMKELIDLLGPNAVKEGIEIIAYRGKVPQEKEKKPPIISAE
ncbi:hypothetical protein IPH92_05035 [Candidatus Kaiserbacteria bacterium]|nr:MAG: hypothetical protein IPH92_05035 [Candidatus Kaiserbacteria bacterium]